LITCIENLKNCSEDVWAQKKREIGDTQGLLAPVKLQLSDWKDLLFIFPPFTNQSLCNKNLIKLIYEQNLIVGEVF